jgi:Tol biopolymer transport system component
MPGTDAGRRTRFTVGLVAMVLVASGCAISRVSVSTEGVQGTGFPGAGEPALSADGKIVAFSSGAPELVAGDDNGVSDVFVHDVTTGVTERVSVRSDGTQGDGASTEPAISADGRYVAFRSAATNLVDDDENGFADVFVHDRVAGTTERVSVRTDGTEGTGVSSAPSIDASGTRIVFESSGPLVSPADWNAFTDIYLRDLSTGTTVLVSSFENGLAGNFVSREPAISADGSTIAFASFTAFSTADPNVFADIYTRPADLSSAPALLTAAPGGSDSNSFAPALDATGSTIAFTSAANNLVPGDSGRFDVFAGDLATGTLTRLSIRTDGTESNNGSDNAAISADGNWVSFRSFASNLVGGDTNAEPDVFRAGVASPSLLRISYDFVGRVESDGPSGPATAISGDGRVVAFATSATNLAYALDDGALVLDDDTNGGPDIVRWEFVL